MTEQQISKLVAVLVEHQSVFSSLSSDDAQWVIQNAKPAIALFVGAIKNRPKPVELLLDPVGTLSIAATTKPFVARDHFIVDNSRKAEVKISYLDDNFNNEFLDKIENSFTGSELRYGKLLKSSVDGPIITELGGEAKAETTLTELWGVLEKQSNGKEGDLLINGYANIFYIRNVAGVLRAMDVCWRGRGWIVYAHSVDDTNRWYDVSQVFSRNSVA